MDVSLLSTFNIFDIKMFLLMLVLCILICQLDVIERVAACIVTYVIEFMKALVQPTVVISFTQNLRNK